MNPKMSRNRWLTQQTMILDLFLGGAFITPDGGEIVGAYTSGESSLTYWIPGRKMYKTSGPIPPDGVTVSAIDRKDVICQTGYLADKHDFYFGEHYDVVDAARKDDDAFKLTLNDDENTFSLPNLSPGRVYYWRLMHEEEIMFTKEMYGAF